MKKAMIAAIVLLAAAVLGFSQPAKETVESSTGRISNVNVGTTSLIEKAVYGEYGYDMLASGVSEIPLVRQDSTGTFHPLAASFETEDAITWTYTVVEGLTWSDGVPVTASDILFTLRYEDEGGSANLIDQTSSDGKTTPAKYAGYALSEDGMSISLTLKSANVRELTNMTSFRIIPEHLFADGDVTDEDRLVTCGPYVRTSFDRSSGTIVFERNGYYPGQTNVDRITYKLFGNEDTMYLALMNGDIDMTFIYSSGTGSTYLEVLEGNDSVKVLSAAAANAPCVFAFNNSDPVFSDVNLRKAVSCALDYAVIAEYVGGKSASVANKGFVPEATVGYKETDRLETDLQKAASLMEAAGYSRNAEGRYVSADGTELVITITYRLDKAVQINAAELCKTQLEAFGIGVVLDGLDSASYNAKTSNKFSNGNITFQTAIFGYTAAGMGMMNGLGTIYVDRSHSVQGGCQVDDPAFTSALSRMEEAATIEQYYEGAHQMQDFYQDYVPLIALYWDNMSYAVASRYDGYAIDNVFGVNNVETWAGLRTN